MRTPALIPFVVFVVIAAVLGIGLTLHPETVPSPLIGKPVPAFELPGVRDPQARIGPADYEGEVWLLNVWATWCVVCRHEHPVLLRAAREHGLTIVGLNYKDERGSARDWLGRLGDPYVACAFDPEGKVGFNLGVYGAPETYVIDKNGVIRHKHIGPLTPTVLREEILPLVRELQSS